MKTQEIPSAKVSISIVIFCALLLLLSACNGKKEETKTGAKVAVADVKPPEIDLHTAVVTNNIEAVNQHIAAGSNLNERDPFGGSSPLITAAVFGKTEMAKVLIDAGADLNFQNNDGSTALITAAFFCRPEIVKLLLTNGADKSIKNKYGATAFQSVTSPFSEVKDAYDMMGKMLEPMGLKLDYAYIEKTRPEIAEMVK
mgnify:CR=1 FL=1